MPPLPVVVGSLLFLGVLLVFKMSFVTAPGGKGIAGRVFGPVINLPAIRHTASVIMLHGLGDTGNGWAPVGAEVSLAHIKWIFPTAPTRPITVNMGMAMPGWFDIDHLDSQAFAAMMKGHRGFDPEGTKESVDYVNQLVAQEVAAGIPHDRIVVGGFSQGGHIALKAALQMSSKLAGCVALSTWLEPSPMEMPHANLEVPTFYGHGSADPLIPPFVAQASLKVLEDLGMKHVNFQLYPGMGHSSCPQELRDLKQFLTKVLPDTAVSKDDVGRMSGRELKQFLTSKGVSTTGLLEKQELLEKALSLL